MQLVNNGAAAPPYKNASSIVHFLLSIRTEAFCKMPSMISSIRSIAKTAYTYAQLALLFSADPSQSTSASCPNAQLSCSSGATTTNYCCFNFPGGLLLQTQFWDTNPPTGPPDSWTIHGLWPDNCDGTYEANCDPAREYTNIRQIISDAGATDLLSYMNTYWKDYQGDDESFWSHEWGKHGTCISTLETSCYTNYVPKEEVVAYFQKAVDLFKGLPSYQFLSAAGIVPSTTATYTAAAINTALRTPRGVNAIIQCKNGALDEIWYFYNVQGSVQSGTFFATNPVGTTSSCPSTGIKYLPKGTSPGGGGGGGGGGVPSGKGTLPITSGGVQKGCVISGGTWYTSGTCASFTATPSGTGFTLTSSKGKCAVSNNVLTCASSVSTAATFTLVGGLLAYNGRTTWYASSVPSGATQASISTTTLATSLTIQWVLS